MSSENQSPEERQLLAETMKDVVLKCTVCGNDVPKRRATAKAYYTCTPECLTRLKAFRQYLRTVLRCMTCHRPHTPKEKADFIAWRKSRGELREGRGRPVAEPKMREVRVLLAEAQQAVGDFADHIMATDGRDETNEVTQLRGLQGRLKNLLDGGAAKSTLAASGGDVPGGES
jgi:uncharacterized protein (DUF983 family)